MAGKYNFIKQVIKNMGRAESKKYGHAIGKKINFKNSNPDEVSAFIRTEMPYKDLKNQTYDILLRDKYKDNLNNMEFYEDFPKTFDSGDRLLQEILQKLRTREFNKYLDNPLPNDIIKNPVQLNLFEE